MYHLFRNVHVAERVGADVRRRWWSQLCRQQRQPAAATAHVMVLRMLRMLRREVAALHLLLMHLPPPGDRLRLQRVKGAP